MDVTAFLEDRSGKQPPEWFIENIRAYGSRLRGPVEVSDGSEHITVRDIYAESSFYGVDVQDHGRQGMINRHS